MDMTSSDVALVNSEPEAILEEENPILHCDAIFQCVFLKQEIEDASAIKRESEMELMSPDVVVVKSEPETILEKESPTFHCDLILQYGFSKQEIEDAPEIKCEPVTLLEQKRAQQCEAYSEIDIDCPNIKRECFVRLERMEQGREFTSVKSSFIGRKDLQAEQSVTGKKSYTCPTCTYKFANKATLARHIRTHTGEKPLSCSKCTYTCSRKDSLLSHYTIHAGEKPFSCSVCSYKSNRKGDLTVHIRTHTGEKPFACSKCTYTCSRKDTLNSHNKTHTEEKPFSCSICTYKSSRKGDLAIHYRTHAGEKPFFCPKCTYVCSRKDNMDTHIRIHTEEKPFFCTE